jgi:hypothetical protein
LDNLSTFWNMGGDPGWPVPGPGEVRAGDIGPEFESLIKNECGFELWSS